ncbi:hypothetical protein D1872_228800 [compost metagenome]
MVRPRIIRKCDQDPEQQGKNRQKHRKNNGWGQQKVYVSPLPGKFNGLSGIVGWNPFLNAFSYFVCVSNAKNIEANQQNQREQKNDTLNKQEDGMITLLNNPSA